MGAQCGVGQAFPGSPFPAIEPRRVLGVILDVSLSFNTQQQGAPFLANVRLALNLDCFAFFARR